MSSSRGKRKVTIDRAKAIKFLIKQEFFKLEQLETKQSESGKMIQLLERDWYQKAANNTAYAQQICTYAVQRHLHLLEKTILKMNSNPDRIQKILTRDHIKQRTHMCINNKIVQFFQSVGLPPPLTHMPHTQQPFIVGNAIPMHPMQMCSHSMNERFSKIENDIGKIQNVIKSDKVKIKGQIMQWLTNKVKSPEYYHVFIECGFDNMENVLLIGEKELDTLRIQKLGHRLKILSEIQKLKNNTRSTQMHCGKKRVNGNNSEIDTESPATKKQRLH